MNRIAVVALISSVVILQSCLFVKAPEQKDTAEHQTLSPLPELEMSEELVRTRQGDMIALVPRDWLFIDTRDEVSDDIITIAVNPEYTLSAVFSSLPSTISQREQLESEGLLGLARIAYSKHARKSAGTVNLIGTYKIAELGTRRFGLYEFSTKSAATHSRCAVFTSTIGNHYEFALVPLTLSGRPAIPDSSQQLYFRSILATIQY